MRIITLLLLLSACSGRSSDQQIALLQKKLATAEKGQRRAQQQIEQLSGELYQAQLAFVQKRVDAVEKQVRERSVSLNGATLFLKEREMLHQIILQGPQAIALQAQGELDRILRVITLISDI